MSLKPTKPASKGAKPAPKPKPKQNGGRRIAQAKGKK